MIAKIVSGHGTGYAASAVHYIAGKMDHKGDKRDEAIHLFGDGQQLIDLTESMTCKHTYLSSVLSFTKEESARLSLEDIQQLAESFAAHHAEPVATLYPQTVLQNPFRQVRPRRGVKAMVIPLANAATQAWPVWKGSLGRAAHQPSDCVVLFCNGVTIASKARLAYNKRATR